MLCVPEDHRGEDRQSQKKGQVGLLSPEPIPSSGKKAEKRKRTGPEEYGVLAEKSQAQSDSGAVPPGASLAETARYIKGWIAPRQPCGPSGVTMIARRGEETEVIATRHRTGPLAANITLPVKYKEAGKKRRHEDPSHADPELTLPE